MFRKAYIEVNLDKIRYNVEYLKKRSDKDIIGVIKANGYGTIDYMEASILKEAGISFFAVSSLDEAINLREKGISDEILILGCVSKDEMNIVRDNNFSIVTLSRKFVSEADLKDVKVHLKLDTGMNRIGVEPDEARDILDVLLQKGARVEGVMSHFSSADSDLEYSNKQYELFRNCVKSLAYDFKYIHMSATDASLIINDDICNYHRIGLGLLGYSAYETDLKPCIRLLAHVSMCKKLQSGETVSYGRHYTSDGKGYLLTIPIGYADGFFRSNAGKKVFVENEYGTIVGSICMDQLMIHTDEYHAEDSIVELFGEHIDIDKRAEELNTITYELLTSLSDRLTHVFIKDGKVYKEINPRNH